MRDIKFRFVYQNKTTREIQFFILRLEDLCHAQRIGNGNYHIWVGDGGDFELIAKDQYTGLADYARKPIYEGDILQWPASKEKAVVEYIANCTQFRLIDHKLFIDCSLGLNIGDKGMAVVIGNIHENPELISGSTGAESEGGVI